MDRHLILASAEIAEAMRDLLFAELMPESEARVTRIASCIAGFERALDRLRYDVLKQERPKPDEDGTTDLG